MLRARLKLPGKSNGMSRPPRDLLWIAAVMLLTPVVGASGQNIDITQIYQNFIASRVAAVKCNALDDGLDRRFLANLMGVAIRATEAVKQRNPSYTEAQLQTSMEAMSNSVQRAVSSEMDNNGCNMPGVQKLIQLYRMHGSMVLG
jgi:hypothetical protein